MVELVTPWSVAPVAWPLPQGEGSVPNLVVEIDEAPPIPGATTTPVAVSVVSNSATPTARMPMVLFIFQPPVHGSGTMRLCPDSRKTIEQVLVLAH